MPRRARNAVLLPISDTVRAWLRCPPTRTWLLRYERPVRAGWAKISRPLTDAQAAAAARQWSLPFPTAVTETT